MHDPGDEHHEAWERWIGNVRDSGRKAQDFMDWWMDAHNRAMWEYHNRRESEAALRESLDRTKS